MAESDEIVYQRFLSVRNEEDLRILLERHREGLILFINGFVHNLADAEEIMLDSFAVAAASRSAFHGRSSFKTWLFSIGKKQALMHLRKSKRYDAGESGDGMADEEAPPDIRILEEERNRVLYLAMEKLNPDYRQTLMLLYFEQMTHEEAGQVMGKNRKQIYHLAERGKKALREILERTGFTYAEY